MMRYIEKLEVDREKLRKHCSELKRESYFIILLNNYKLMTVSAHLSVMMLEC